jgi:S-adenosylhomocysteine hydrolase
LWGVSSDGLKYELYYTERAIESLTEFLLHYQPADFKPMPNTELEEPKVEICSEVSEPAGETTLEIVPAYLPILDEIARKAAKKKGDLFKDVIIIYVLHFLNDLLPFIDKFRSLGCNPQDMFFLVKTYEYPEKDKIRKYLEDIGCTVFLPKDATEKALFAAANAMLKKCIDTSEGKGSKILIVEDGGYFAPMFHTPNFRDSIAKCIGAVEQTTKGHRRDSEIADPKFPIISVASSKLKMVLEAQDVAETLQENIVGILRKYADKPLNNLRALVLGYGTIGEKLCDALHNKGIAINVFDKDAFKRLRAEMQNKYKVLDGLDNLTGFNIIIGVSGETSLKNGEAFWNLDHNVILASGSSERVEFDLEALASNSSKISREEIFTKYTLKKGDKVIRLLLDGEPINFAISGGISNSVIDPIYSEMFLAAVQIRASEGMANGLQDLPIEIEEEVLKIFKTYHRT